MAEISRILVIGAGTMGNGIAHVAAAAGYPVLFHDISEELIRSGMRPLAGSNRPLIWKPALRPPDW